MPKFLVFLRKFGDATVKTLFFSANYADDSARRLFPALVLQNSAIHGVRQSYLLYFPRGYGPPIARLLPAFPGIFCTRHGAIGRVS